MEMSQPVAARIVETFPRHQARCRPGSIPESESHWPACRTGGRLARVADDMAQRTTLEQRHGQGRLVG